jgi:hypothetical protein
MSKLGIAIGSAIALSVVATGLYYRPSGASNDLLAKAQSEFTAKARDAVLQRQAQPGPALASSSTSEVLEPTHPVASAEPAAPSAAAPLQGSERSTPARPAVTSEAMEPTPPVALAEPLAPSAPAPATLQSSERSIPERPAATAETPVVVAKPAVVEAAAASEPKLEDIKPEPKLLPEVKPVLEAQPVPEAKPVLEAKPVAVETGAQNIEAPKQPEPPKAAAPQVVTPATVKMQKTTHEPAKTASAKKTGPSFRQLEREFSSGRMPYDPETLRARAPGIAAALAPYMPQ